MIPSHKEFDKIEMYSNGWLTRPFRYISECNNSEFQHEMHVSSFGYCSQLNFNSECQCIVLIIFLHEAFVAIEIEIEQNSLDGSFCSSFSTRFIKQNSGKSLFTLSRIGWHSMKIKRGCLRVVSAMVCLFNS
jgi:hypothetical protein